MTAFVAIMALLNRAKGERIQDLSGMASRAPFLAFALTFALVSLIGLPPTGLFVGKIYLFYGAVQSGLWWLALAGVLNSFISAYYYLRPIRAMYVTTSSQGERGSEDAIGETAETPAPSVGLRASLGLSVAGIIVLGVAPAWLIARATEAAQTLVP